MPTIWEGFGHTTDPFRSQEQSRFEEERRKKEARIVYARIGIQYDAKDAAEFRKFLGL
jgi:hypothetical protein